MTRTKGLKGLKKITLYPVVSSTVEAVGFKKPFVFVKYRKGTIYQFNGFDSKKFVELMSSESVGKVIRTMTGIPVTEGLDRFRLSK